MATGIQTSKQKSIAIIAVLLMAAMVAFHIMRAHGGSRGTLSVSFLFLFVISCLLVFSLGLKRTADKSADTQHSLTRGRRLYRLVRNILFFQIPIFCVSVFSMKGEPFSSQIGIILIDLFVIGITICGLVYLKKRNQGRPS